MFSLFWFAYLLEKCDLMISNDTWPMHLSAAMWTKTIWLFWPNLPSRFWPYPLNKNVWIYKWNWKTSINVHLGEFEEDKNCNVCKIKIEDVLNVMCLYWVNLIFVFIFHLVYETEFVSYPFC
jgi:ADP-heptose:LPS heptosyltransferase